MRVHKLTVDVSDDHKLEVQLPADFPPGPAEVIVLASYARRSVVSLGGVLTPEGAIPEAEDPILAELDALRRERAGRLDRLTADDG